MSEKTIGNFVFVNWVACFALRYSVITYFVIVYEFIMKVAAFHNSFTDFVIGIVAFVTKASYTFYSKGCSVS